MNISDEEVEALGLAFDDEAIICPKCERGLKFNSGNPAVFHEDGCPSGEKITYVGQGRGVLNVTKMGGQWGQFLDFLEFEKDELMTLFVYSHLKNEDMQEISKACADLAQLMESKLPMHPETVAGLRKLVEAKDCFVRAMIKKNA